MAARVQVQKGVIQLNAVVAGMALWCLSISQALQHPLYDVLMASLEVIPTEDFDTHGLHRICTVSHSWFACVPERRSAAVSGPASPAARRTDGFPLKVIPTEGVNTHGLHCICMVCPRRDSTLPHLASELTLCDTPTASLGCVAAKHAMSSSLQHMCMVTQCMSLPQQQ